MTVGIGGVGSGALVRLPRRTGMRRPSDSFFAESPGLEPGDGDAGDTGCLHGDPLADASMFSHLDADVTIFLMETD